MTALQAAVRSGQSTYNWEVAKSREARNIHRNWTKVLEEQQRHVCEVAGKASSGQSSKKLSPSEIQSLVDKANQGNTVTNYYINDIHYVAVDDGTEKSSK